MAGELKDLEMLIRVVGAERVRAALDSISQGEEQVGKKSEEAQNKQNQLGKSLDGLTNKLVNFVAATASIGTVVSLWNNWLGVLKETEQTLSRIAKIPVQTQTSVIKLAHDLGDTSESGLTKATSIASDISKAGGLPNIEMGADIFGAVSDALSITDQKKAIQASKSIARIAGRAGVGPGGIGNIAEMLNVLGTGQDQNKIEQVLAQLDAAFNASGAKDMGAFAGAVIEGGRALIPQGVGIEQTMQMVGQARAVSGGSDQEAGGMVSAIVRSLGKQPIQKYMKRQGLGKAPIQEQMEAMEALIESAEGGQDPQAEKLIRDTIDARERLRIRAFFSAAARRKSEDVQTAISKSSPENIQQQTESFLGSKVGISRLFDLNVQLQKTAMGTDQLKQGLIAGEIEDQIQRTKLSDPKAFILPGSEAAARDLMRKRLGSALGLPGTELPQAFETGGNVADSFNRTVAKPADSFIDNFFKSVGPAMGGMYGGNPNVNINNYIETQIAPQREPTSLPAETTNARPGVQ